MTAPRPSIFIGSSTKGLPVASAIQQNLDYTCEPVIWSQGVFGLSGGTLETLVTRAPDFDFAVLVATPDDMVMASAGHADQVNPIVEPCARDNVLIEIGLFVGFLGRDRTFIVYDRTADMRIPSDLAGITMAGYQQHSSGNLQAALGACCTSMLNTISRLGIRTRSQGAAIDEQTHFEAIRGLLDIPQRQVFILMHETACTLKKESLYGPGIEYAYVAANGMAGRGGVSVRTLCEKLPNAGLLQQDLVDNVSLTKHGHDFATWLMNNGQKVQYFNSTVGTWGEPPPEFPQEWRTLTNRFFPRPPTG
jgi:hypothetical protein